MSKALSLSLLLLVAFCSDSYGDTFKYTLRYGIGPCKINPGVSMFCDNAIYTSLAMEVDPMKPKFWSKVIIADILSKPYSFYLSTVAQKEKSGPGYFAVVAINDANWGTDLGKTIVLAEKIEQLNKFKLTSSLVTISETEAYLLHVWFEPTK